MGEKIKNRYNILIVFFVLVGAALIYQLFNLQIVNGAEYDKQSQQKILNERKIVAPRGEIFDRNGIPIATNRQGFIIQLVKTKMPSSLVDDMLLELVNIFEKNNDNYYKSLSNYLTFNPIAYGPAINQSESKIQKWKEGMVDRKSDLSSLKTADDVFRYLRNVKFRIDSKYTDEQAYKIMTVRYEILIRGYSSLNPISLAVDVSKETVAEVEERYRDFPGVITDIKPVRKYNDGETNASIVGYVAGLNPDEYNHLKENGYSMNDIIGKTGIEKAFEGYLKGKDGQKSIEADVNGKQVDVIDQKPAVPGNNVILTIDSKLQKVAMESLQRNIEMIKNKAGYTDVNGNLGDANAGAVVAMDISNGEVLAMTSYPSYDPAIFLAGPDNKEAQKAIAALYDPNGARPTLNRAISGIYAPGSTFKPITSIAGLEEGFITPDTIINDNGVVDIDGMKFYSMEYKNGKGTFGPLNLEKALATSCNTYFYQLGIMEGIDNIDKWAKFFGLGNLTGIDIPGEIKGILAGKDYKKKVFNDAWRRADSAQAAIGQIYNAFTPIELADYVSTLANGGKRYTPHLVKKIVNNDGPAVTEPSPKFEQVPVKQSTIEAVKKGMIAVTNSEDGTAVSIFRDFPFKVAGKTGTAETSEKNHSNNAVFICYAPADNPKIAVAVVIEKGVFGYFAAPVAKDIMTAYFNLSGS